MSKEVQITLPKLGESILSATVVQWFKKEGDIIKEDEPLLEVTTDKVNSEIPSTVAGVLKQILANPDEEVEVGAPLAIILVDAEARVTNPSREEDSSLASSHQVSATYLSPAVLRLASENGINMHELEKIQAAQEGGRISKKDIEAYLKKRHASTTLKSLEDIEKVKMSHMRKAIADNMVKSFYGAPHASLVVEVDVSRIMKYIASVKQSFLEKHGYKLTVTSFIAKALAEAVKEYPLINSSLEEDTIVVKRFVNLGIAVSVDQGIMVPVIKGCHVLTLEDIAKALSEVSHRARYGELKVEETKEGTITITNFGMSGTLMGIPIIRYPEVAIVGIGAITKRVVVTEEETIGIRSMLYVSLTFDHRVIDGIYGCDFLSTLKRHLEEFKLS